MNKKMLTVFVLLLLAAVSPAQIVMPNAIGGSGGGGSVASGSAISGCTAYSIVTIDASGNLKCDPASVVNGSLTSAGRSTLTIRDSIAGNSSTSNFLSISGRGNTATSVGLFFTSLIFSSSASDTSTASRVGMYLQTNPETAGSGKTSAVATGIFLVNSMESTGTTADLGTVGTWSRASSGGSSFNTGLYGLAYGASTTNIGVYGNADPNGASTSGATIGVMGQGGNSAVAGPNVGGYFSLAGDKAPSLGNSAAAIANNGTQSQNIFEGRDNGAVTSATAASANVAILDGAQMRLGNQALTSATMTPTIVSEARTVTHSYAWTNAMVAALGASLEGDITVATLPAKTQINNAYVVIDTAAAGVTTLTVSCGDAIAGTPFINYIVASDAKAAANTVYGDAVAERGTSIDVEFYYVPSYTATTLVTCHFISTVQNLSATTTSTGRLILTTTLLP